MKYIEVIDKSIGRVEGYLEKHENIKNIYVISNSKLSSKMYIDTVGLLINIKKYNVIYISDNTLKCGMDTKNSIILLCGLWHRNKAIKNNLLWELLNKTYAIPLADVPSKMYDRENDKVKYIWETHSDAL